MLKYLPDRYLVKLIDRETKPVSAKDQQFIAARLAPFALQNLEDKNQVVELPIPNDFESVDEELEKAYLNYATRYSRIETLVHRDAPSLPTHFYCPFGWSYWDIPNKQWVPIEMPPKGRAFVLDAETVEVSPGIWHPVCMVAMSNTGWLVWRADLTKVNDVSVVPFTTNNDILGYNISYDRSFIDVEYRYEKSGNRFYDLMSMWIVTNGMSNQQRQVYKKYGKSDSDDGEDESYGTDLSKPTWLQKTATNGLAQAYKFYTGKELDKGVREGIVEIGLSWIGENMAEVIRYCALDVLATHELAQHLLPAYFRHRPSEINRYGAVALGSCWVPLSADRFPSFYERVEAIYRENKNELNELLMEAATAFLEQHSEPTETTKCLDWTPAKSGINKGQPKWFRDLLSNYKQYKKLVAEFGYADKGGLTLGQRWAPLVLEMRWNQELLFWDEDQQGFYTEKHGLIPHPTKRGQPVANMFLKDFAGLHEDGFITVPEYVRELAAKKTASINWVSTRKRIASIHTESPDGYPVTIPMMSPNGTITGRATDSIWQVTANPKEKRIGTELKSMVAPFEGYSFVGADVNS